MSTKGQTAKTTQAPAKATQAPAKTEAKYVNRTNIPNIKTLCLGTGSVVKEMISYRSPEYFVWEILGQLEPYFFLFELTPFRTAPVPETLLKKRKTQQQLREAALKRRRNITKNATLKRRVIFKKAEKYVAEYRKQERALINARRVAKKGGNLFLKPEAKLAFVIRIRGTQGLHPKPRKILQLLRLRQVNNGVFVKLTRSTRQMLTLIEPYVTYGYPSLKTVRELVYKRGFGKINKQRIPLTSNKVVEDSLGKRGIICVEDLIHEIITVGPNFKYANKFLWTFKLSPPVKGWSHVLTHYNDGGDFGNREETINELVERMN